MPSSNFTFLRDEYPILYKIGEIAEHNSSTDSVTSIFKLRQFGEKLSEILFDEHKLEFPKDNTFHNRLKELDHAQILPNRVKDLLFLIKQKGNDAVHNNIGTAADARQILFSTFKVAKWFYETYASNPTDISNLKFHISDVPEIKSLVELERQYKELDQKYQQVLKDRVISGLSQEQTKVISRRSAKAVLKVDMSEAETRLLIDEQLRLAGWEADTEMLNYRKRGTVPQRGKNIAIAEWPVGSKRADYALFVGFELYGIVEAKKYAQDISTDLGQSKIYASLATSLSDDIILGDWSGYKVPFLFSTNGRPYLEQLKTKSGVWFLDVRNRHSISRPLKGWYSPQGLKKLYEKDLDDANNKLRNASLGFLQEAGGLGLRQYQIDAIKAIENVLLDHSQPSRSLIAMATGTGKTRTIIGLCYHLIQTNRFRRILFLVDRRLLGIQAINAFKDNKVVDLNTFAEIYGVKGLSDKLPEEETRLHFSTVQSMVKRLFYNDNEGDIPPVDQFDCIIIDEAHRGYLLDREMDEEELNFKDQTDYVSKYRMVLDYFDAYAVGLTATPALHTTEIFGSPIYYYSYRDAVVDGYLIDHEPPYIIKTRLSEEGIKWERGECPKVYDREQNTIVELGALEDELKLDIADFNKKVLTAEFNRTVVKELVKYLDPDGDEKTLIFAATDEHADEIVMHLKEEFINIGVDVPDDAIRKITGKSYDPEALVTKYKNEKFPNIAVTVDLLTTGIDVPAICNIVFMRRVKSRILYEQMLGRATRRCDDIGKETFKIFDAVRLYETLQDYTQMKPVVVNPATPFAQLSGEMDRIDSRERSHRQIEQIIAKLQRKKRKMKADDLDQFSYNAQNMQPDQLISLLRNQPIEESIATIKNLSGLWKFLDDWKPAPNHMLVSEHEDMHTGTERGYGAGLKPEDYLQKFEAFIKNNQTRIAALNIVCTRPQELTRADLRSLRIELEQHGFSAAAIKTAWKDVKNEDIAADIISFIRTLAIGNSLVSHEERIKRAVDKVRGMHKWNQTQKKWLDRIEKQLMQEYILQPDDFERQPFSDAGGYQRIDKIFDHKLANILEVINENLYKETA